LSSRHRALLVAALGVLVGSYYAWSSALWNAFKSLGDWWAALPPY
jgi:predicted metal-binding membrane protein